MQNQWFNRPDTIKAALASYGDDKVRAEKYRRRLIEFALFRGCKSGRVLRKVFGDLCDDIIWEEASREIGGHAASIFPADLPHMRAVIDGVEPRVVLAFGKIAGDAMKVIHAELDIAPMDVIYAPHPAARHTTVLGDLHLARAELNLILNPGPIEIFD